MNVVTGILTLAGFFFILTGAVGILRLPDFYCRLHAMGKSDTLGVALVLGALALEEGVSLISVKILLIVVFVSLANPTATHALGRAARRSGLRPWFPDGARRGLQEGSNHD
jgi:multicomponent Na+:H+ antiporter subunit G